MRRIAHQARLPRDAEGQWSSRGTIGWVEWHGDTITAVESGPCPSERQRGAEECQDLGGGWLLPAFCESHAHVHYSAQQSAMIDVRPADDDPAALADLITAAAATSPDEWLIGHGWHERLLDAVGPSVERWLEQRVDPRLDDRPLFLWSWDHHRALVNREAAARLGRPGEAGVWIEHDALAGWNRIPPRPDQLERELDRWLRRGVTAIATFDGAASIEAFGLLSRRSPLPVRIRHSLPWEAWTSEDPTPDGLPIDGFASDPARAHDVEHERFAVLWVKLFLDGTLGSRTAWLQEPYRDDPAHHGVCRVSEEEFARGCARWLATEHAGLGLAVHAIGDRAVATAADWIERMQERRGCVGLDRIEHAQLIDDRALERLRRVDLALALQPCHAPDDWSVARRHWGIDRLSRTHAWRTLSTVAPILLGSDAPIASADPWANLRVATAFPGDGEPPARESECLDFEDAFRAYTSAAQAPLRLPSGWGTIAVGSPADFQWLRTGRALPEITDLGAAEWAATWVAGECRARSEDGEVDR